MDIEKIKILLNDAQNYANRQSGCKKVAVGSIILGENGYYAKIFGANKTLPCNCRKHGCQREELYGEDSKNHRLPSDCRAIHSEIDVISQAAYFGVPLLGSTIIVTRYPCEACARAIVNAGISKVYYGRQQEISKQTKEIFKKGNVQVFWIKDWTYEDTTR